MVAWIQGWHRALDCLAARFAVALHQSSDRALIRGIVSRMQYAGPGIELHSTRLLWPERIILGSHTYIGPDCTLNARGGLSIEDHTIVGPEVVILTAMHSFRDADLVPYGEKELLRPVKIGRAVWIGYRAMILPGVTIGEGSIVGAGSVVTKSCEPGTILAGNPAKVIGQRDMTLYNQCVSNGRFYLRIKQLDHLDKVEVTDVKDTSKHDVREY